MLGLYILFVAVVFKLYNFNDEELYSKNSKKIAKISIIPAFVFVTFRFFIDIFWIKNLFSSDIYQNLLSTDGILISTIFFILATISYIIIFVVLFWIGLFFHGVLKGPTKKYLEKKKD
jgi:uncharacterized membrane protein